MRVIWKYGLKPDGPGNTFVAENAIQGAVVLVDYDNTGTLSVWIDGNSDDEKAARRFAVRGTGDIDLPRSISRHVKSWTDGLLVWHLFEYSRNG